MSFVDKIRGSSEGRVMAMTLANYIVLSQRWMGVPCVPPARKNKLHTHRGWALRKRISSLTDLEASNLCCQDTTPSCDDRDRSWVSPRAGTGQVLKAINHKLGLADPESRVTLSMTAPVHVVDCNSNLLNMIGQRSPMIAQAWSGGRIAV